MARKPTLTGDLAALAEEERSRLGEPPDADLLIAFHAGELPEDEMERVRDWLAVDPEWASIYLELKRGGLDAGGVASTGLAASGAEDPEVEAAWRALVPKLKREAGAAEVVPFPRRRLGRALLAVAAAVVVVAGLAWLVVGRGGPGLPEGKYYEVAVNGKLFRGLRIEIPQDYVGLEFRIVTNELSGRIVIELHAASGESIRRKSVVIEPESEEVVFRVASSSLRGKAGYTLSLQKAGASPDDPLLLKQDFRVIFEE